MQLSVIILNYNVRYFLEQCIQSVQSAISNMDAEIIVVDNASSDDSCAMIASKFPSVTLIKNKDNAGFPKGNNQGAVIAKGQYLCILNPDTLVAEDAFTKLISFAEQQKDHGISGVKLIDGSGNFLRESKRGVPTPWVAFTKVTGLYKLSPKWFGKYYAMHLPTDKNGETAVLTGAFMLIKRELYRKAGGFDEGCFMYSDDIDLSYRIRQMGYTNYYFSETAAIHYKGESTLKDRLYLQRFREAMRYFYKKHFKANWLFDLLLRFGILLFSLLKLFQGKSSEKQQHRPDQYILISDDVDLKSILEKKLENKLLMMDVAALSEQKPFSGLTEIIFDGNRLSNTKIISLMETLKHKNHRFKIRPKGCDFILGSYHSHARGEVVVFD